MGREAKIAKDRVCKTCKETFFVDAQGIKDHSKWCGKANE
jgi:hypothetical protein